MFGRLMHVHRSPVRRTDPPGHRLAAQPRPAAINHRPAQVSQRTRRVGWTRTAGMNLDEHVLNDVLARFPAPDQQRGQPDELQMMLAKQLSQVPGVWSDSRGRTIDCSGGRARRPVKLLRGHKSSPGWPLQSPIASLWMGHVIYTRDPLTGCSLETIIGRPPD